MNDNDEKWWVKKPRSSRECLNCGHKYASHIDVKCIKVVQSTPKLECDCLQFIGTPEELKMYKKKILIKNDKRDKV